MQSDEAARIERERDFHDRRFGADIQEEPRLKFYWALQDCTNNHKKAISLAAKDAEVLEYGCAEGEYAVSLASVARTVHGIDISPVAIDSANALARAAGTKNVTFSVADAMETGFADCSFDLVYGSGIIHHLDTERSLREIRRILRPGGVAIFQEPLAGNFILQLYRRATPESRTPDEHPLVSADLALGDKLFSRVDYKHYGLFTIGVVPFRKTRLMRPIYRALAFVDRIFFRLPGLRWQAWYVGMTMVK